MPELKNIIKTYLEYCRYQKKLSPKSLKAYAIDLGQFQKFNSQAPAQLQKQSERHTATPDCQTAADRQQNVKDLPRTQFADSAAAHSPIGKVSGIEWFHKSHLSSYIISLHKQYKPKTIKRKIATLKAFFAYLEYEDLIDANPFSKLKTKFQEPQTLPRTIPFSTIRKILKAAYKELDKAVSPYRRAACLRDTAVLEMLFATGLRVSELCSLKCSDINLRDGSIRILGKGSKERLIQIGNQEVLTLLRRFNSEFKNRRGPCPYFFVNKHNSRLSEQSVRFMVRRYSEKANITMHITPHMFRHSFATLLLEEDVDIRYIQQMLGHSSIVTTQIYTHVAARKQKKILTAKHPRNKMVMNNS